MTICHDCGSEMGTRLMSNGARYCPVCFSVRPDDERPDGDDMISASIVAAKALGALYLRAYERLAALKADAGTETEDKYYGDALLVARGRNEAMAAMLALLGAASLPD